MTWLLKTPNHHCSPPSTRKRDFGVGSLWQCPCGQAWEFYENWAGDGWATVTVAAVQAALRGAS